MTEQKLKKKKRSVSVFMQDKEVKLDYLMYSKKTNKMWSLKSLAMLMSENRTGLHALQHK